MVGVLLTLVAIGLVSYFVIKNYYPPIILLLLGEKYDGRGQIIIERGQFFRTNLHGAVQDRPHFKIMKRGHLTS